MGNTMFIEVVTKYDHQYRDVEQVLITLFGYNDHYWFKDDRDNIKVYYKNVSELEHALNK